MEIIVETSITIRAIHRLKESYGHRSRYRPRAFCTDLYQLRNLAPNQARSNDWLCQVQKSSSSKIQRTSIGPNDPYRRSLYRIWRLRRPGRTFARALPHPNSFLDARVLERD